MAQDNSTDVNLSLDWHPMSWVKDLIEDDSSKTLQSMKEEVDSWRELEDFVENWGIEFTGMYQGPPEKEREVFLRRNFFKFADRKLSDHLKKKEEDKNPLVVTAGKVREMANPKAEFSLMDSIKLKFRAKPLLGEAYLFLVNPYIDVRTEIYSSGSVRIAMERELDFFGLSTEFNYLVDKREWSTSLRKDIADYLEGKISSVQRIGSYAFSSESEQRFELIFSRQF